jgi:geranylgeranylglycerol-phosphate geranylgeranyltransferase
MRILGRARTLLDLIRLRNAVIAFFGVYVGALVFSLGTETPNTYLAAAVSAALILGAGNAMNDYFDVEIDRINRPHRPIPSGRITRSDALMVSFALYLIGLGVAKSINDYCLVLAAANTAILIIYALYSKRMLLLSNVCVSYLVASVFVYGAASVYQPNAPINPDGIKLAAVLTICAFFLNLSREIMKDIEDMEGDSKASGITIPLKYGAEKAKTIAAASAVFAVIFSVTPLIAPTAAFNELIYGLTIAITNIIIIVSFTTPPTINQRLLVLSMTLALTAFLLGVLTPHPPYVPTPPP